MSKSKLSITIPERVNPEARILPDSTEVSRDVADAIHQIRSWGYDPATFISQALEQTKNRKLMEAKLTETGVSRVHAMLELLTRTKVARWKMSRTLPEQLDLTIKCYQELTEVDLSTLAFLLDAFGQVTGNVYSDGEEWVARVEVRARTDGSGEQRKKIMLLYDGLIHLDACKHARFLNTTYVSDWDLV